jgi:hypothetical protein
MNRDRAGVDMISICNATEIKQNDLAGLVYPSVRADGAPTVEPETIPETEPATTPVPRPDEAPEALPGIEPIPDGEPVPDQCPIRKC